MRFLMPRWFLSLSIQWKLQFGFFLVTMITIVVNRLEGYAELGKLIEIARSSGVSEAVIRQLETHHETNVAAARGRAGRGGGGRGGGGARRAGRGARPGGDRGGARAGGGGGERARAGGAGARGGSGRRE